jgi:hypothetical protein
MKFSLHILSFICIVLFVSAFGAFTEFKPSEGASREAVLSEALLQGLSVSNPHDRKLIWVYFRDKQDEVSESMVSERSLNRRSIRSLNSSTVDESDAPVSSSYISAVASTGAAVRNRSKWFNAVSCTADDRQIGLISQFAFVRKIDLVARYKHVAAESSDGVFQMPESQGDDPLGINYGPSLNQSNLINVPAAHDRGFTGTNVLIASFDAGFDNLEHICFNKIRNKGIRSYDFVNGDTIVANGTGRMGNGAHGTLTLSLIAAYDPGRLVSPAFDAQYLLAKTENTESETPLEEDNWVAAAEWADSLGADIITSSLGYLSFNPPHQSYTWQSMNGSTALISRAADIAVSKGIVVVTSAGNDGFNSSHNTLNAPADAFNVVTVGAVTLGKQRAAFSSIGPTVDGRIKPDVMALGVNNYTARFGAGGVGYLNSNVGTSLACPMVAGVCAMLLSANPELTPLQVKDILRNTASNSTFPNSQMGYGIVDAWSAVQLAFVTGTNGPADYILSQNYPNPFNPSTTFRFSLTKAAKVSLLVYDLRGRLIETIVRDQVYTAGVKEITMNFSSLHMSSGTYLYSLIVNDETIDTKKMMLVK